ncbi:MAG: cation-binding protein [Crenarchaeota archaeon]|nr:cation-binding protein [Thermoproteota archaeon]
MQLPIDVLIKEHQLIIQAIVIIKKEIVQIETRVIVDPNFVDASVDFLRIYADRFHHGKEEGILFKGLSQRKLSNQDHQVMRELVMEHADARRIVTALEAAKENYLAGKKEVIKELLDLLKALVKLYPEHIEKEDNLFFSSSMAYFSKQEQDEMLTNFLEFNQNFTDKRYNHVVALLSNLVNKGS